MNGMQDLGTRVNRSCSVGESAAGMAGYALTIVGPRQTSGRLGGQLSYGPQHNLGRHLSLVR
jgi:hypothetical protein